VEIQQLDECPSRALTEFDSSGGVVRFVARSDNASIVQFELAEGGCVGLHPAVTDQVLIVVSGAGQVRTGPSQPIDVSAGDVVRWEAGEEHETTSTSGLVALVVEAPLLQFRT
jgi:quercetin dioxygenase-like cupin family protein